MPYSHSSHFTPLVDLFIIGGGINGAGIAADAAGRGLNTILCEQGDLAQGTSSASSKIIHGGLRYLELYDFKLVRKGLKEREILLQKAPHIISPLKFVLPYVPGFRSRWMIRAGLWLYDHLAKRRYLPSSHAVNLRTSHYGAPLKPTFTEGFVYADCWVDDARLVILNAIAAGEKGAHIYTRQKVIKTMRTKNYWKITTFDTLHQQEHEYHARILINATGPWVEQSQKHSIQHDETFSIKLVKGSHIVVPRLYQGQHAYILMNTDKRVIFSLPYMHEFTLIGTTEIAYQGDPKEAHIDTTEIDYLCAAANQYFSKQVTSHDIIWSYSGVRPLRQQQTANLSKISRDYQLKWDTSSTQAPLLTIIGGKITTYRQLAEQTVNQLQAYFPQQGKAWTAITPLPGGDILDRNIELFTQQCSQQYPWLPLPICQRYTHTYGTRIHRLLADASNLTHLGIDFGYGLYQKEVEYLMQHEWARTAEDILWRRTKLGLFFSAAATAQLESWLQNLNFR